MSPIVRRFRVGSIAAAVTAASAASGAAFAMVTTVAVSHATSSITAVVVFGVTFASAAWVWGRRWTLSRAASSVEARQPGLDNLIVTAAAAADGAIARPLHPVVNSALWDAARERLQALSPSSIAPLIMSIGVAVASFIAAMTLVVWFPGPGSQTATPSRDGAASAAMSTLVPGDLRVTVQPPNYARRSPQTLINPGEVTVIEGSRVSLEVASSENVELVEPGHAPIAFARAAARARLELVADDSKILLIQPADERQARDRGRLLHLIVDRDRRPVVRILQPGKDLIVADGTGQFPVEIEAQDDLGLATLVLRYTRVAGSGETFTFQEGDIPVTVDRSSDSAWKGRATLALPALQLESGDTVVYRAMATDRKPGADASSSESYLIEVGRMSGLATTGFAVPEDRDRQGLSQQMLIVKTERLHATRSTLSSDAVLEQSRLLAIEQRMVRSEFVFMTGGEVEDEVAEAEAGHELAEGRQENQSQLELLAAIRDMSRAESRLNAAETEQALVFERAALRALQRAFDRRRYLLRTLPERTRIDRSRRLTGDAKDARSTVRNGPAREPDARVAAARAALNALAAAVGGRTRVTASLASQLLAVDPDSPELRRAVLALSTASDTAARADAARTAEQLVMTAMLARAGAAPQGSVANDPLRGRFADALARGPR
jgi:hypothetical protein